MVSMKEKRKLLLVDDEDVVRLVMRTMIEEIGFEVVEACNGLEGVELFDRESPDLVFTDLQMPEMDGLTFISRLKDKSANTPIVVVSGTGNVQSAIEAIRLGAWDYVTKPVEALECLDIVAQRVLERARLIAENRIYQEHLEEMVMQRTAQLRDSEMRFRTIFESANDGIMLMQDECIISCNRKIQEMLGVAADVIVGRSLLSFSPQLQPSGSTSQELHQAHVSQVLTGEPQAYEWRFVRGDGVVCDVDQPQSS